jgi:tripartite-type tricarboxylate transporter receptor subunit TctC
MNADRTAHALAHRSTTKPAHRGTARRAVHGVLLAACSALTATHAMAQAYPNKPIKVIVPYSPGGSTDVIARIIADGLPKRLKIETIVENKPGGNTAIATQYVAAAPPDGYTIYVTNTAPHSMLPSMYSKLPFDGEKDYTAIAVIADIQLAMFTPTDKKTPTFDSVVKAAKASPGKMSYAHTGISGVTAIATEMIKSQLGMDVQAIAYPGSPGIIQSLITGDSDFAINDLGTMMPHVRSGKLVAVGALADKRLASLPDVPTFKETGLPIDIPTIWVGVTGPAGIPPAVLTT